MSKNSPVDTKADEAIKDLQSLLNQAFYDELRTKLQEMNISIEKLAKELGAVKKEVSALNEDREDRQPEPHSVPVSASLSAEQREILRQAIQKEVADAVQRALQTAIDQHTAARTPPAETSPVPEIMASTAEAIREEAALVPSALAAQPPSISNMDTQLTKLRRYVFLSIVLSVVGWLLPAISLWFVWR